MTLASIARLYRARLGARLVLVQELFAVLGIAVGVALLFASQVASTSLNSSVRQLTKEVVGEAKLQLVARTPAGFPQRLVGEVRALPGVRAAAPVLEEHASVSGPAGERSVDLIAVDPHFVHLGGLLLRRFSAAQLAGQHAIALPAPLARAVGVVSLQTVRLQIGASAVTTLVGTKLDETDIGGLIDSPIVVSSLGYGQEIAGMKGRITRVFVQPQAGREGEVRAELGAVAGAGDVNVEPANFDATLFDRAAEPANQSELLFAAISALVGFLFAFNAMLITLPLRRTLVENLRRRGASRLMTVQVLAFDAVVLGVLACVLGLALGDVLSVAVFKADPGYLAYAFPVGSQRIVTWHTAALAVAAGMLAASVGVLAPLRDILARPLRLAARPQGAGRRLTAAAFAIGLACLAGTTALLVTGIDSVPVAVLAVAGLIAAMLLMLPLLFDTVVAVFDRVQRPLYLAAPRLAVVELQTPANRVRSVAIAATGAVAVLGSVAMGGAAANLQRGLDAAVRDIDSAADIWVTAAGASNTFATTPFKDVASGALARLPGVRAVRLYRGGFFDWNDRRVWVLAPPRDAARPVPPSQVPAGAAALATAHVRAGGWVVLSKALASEHGLRVGARFTLPSPRPLVVRVAALSTNLGWPPGALVMNAADYARAWGSGDPSAYQIQLAPGAAASAVSGEVRRALGPQTGLAVETAGQRMRRHFASTRQALARLTQIGTLLLIAAALAMAGAMGSMIWQRRPTLAYIKRQGFGRGVLWCALFLESSLLLGTGCSVGALFGVYGQLLQSHALATVTGFPVDYSVGALIAITRFALVSAVAVAIIAVPGYLAVRVRPSTVSPA
ncbi:MAG TPA: FtsX-like permease family protein [Solirubrobacteraceae bacterium]